MFRLFLDFNATDNEKNGQFTVFLIFLFLFLFILCLIDMDLNWIKI
jgi:hypothetical protein